MGGSVELLEEGTMLALPRQRRSIAVPMVIIVMAALKVCLPLACKLAVGCVQRHCLQCSL